MYTGGPMFWADTIGLEELVQKIRQYGIDLGGEHWNLSPLLERLAADGNQLQGYSN